MLNPDDVQEIISELDDAQSLVEQLQERVLALERDNRRQRLEFIEFRTSTERALGTSSQSRQRRVRASRQPPLPRSVGTPEAELDDDNDPPPTTPPPQSPSARLSTPSTASPPPLRSFVTIIAGKDRKKCEGNVYRVIRPAGKHFSIISNANLLGAEIKKANSSLARTVLP